MVSDPYLADFFEEVAKEVDAVEASKWIAVWVKGWANREKIEFRNSRISSKDVVFLIELINKGTLSERNAKWILYDLVRGEKLTEILKNKEYHQISKKDKLGKIVEETVKENSDAVLSYVSGKREALNFLVGEVMRKTKGRAKPQVVLDMIKERIENESVE